MTDVLTYKDWSQTKHGPSEGEGMQSRARLVVPFSRATRLP